MQGASSFAIHKKSLPPITSPDERSERARQMLARTLVMGTTVGFVGAGCSVPLGFPTWTGFATSVVKKTIEWLETKNASFTTPTTQQFLSTANRLDDSL